MLSKQPTFSRLLRALTVSVALVAGVCVADPGVPLVDATCDAVFDLSDPSVADPVPGLEPGSRTGASLVSAGDLNGDGVGDFVGAAPDFDTPLGPDAGAVAVYFGSADRDERATADVIFVGAGAFDRAGTSVAAGFEYTLGAVTLPALLIGAEQLDRSFEPPVAVGPGRVYLVLFDTTDTSLYPNLGNPDIADVIDLSEVGRGIPGVVFEGAVQGDRVGADVAVGQMDPDPGVEFLFGAPGRDNGTEHDAGAVYLLYSDSAFGGIVRLDRVASDVLPPVDGDAGQHTAGFFGHVDGDDDDDDDDDDDSTAIDGVLYLGTLSGDEFGASVSFVGDLVGDELDDFAAGAPGADKVGAANTGRTYVGAGRRRRREVIEVCDIGRTREGTQVEGKQVAEKLGAAVRCGGDNLMDGNRDLLIGAPGFDGDGREDAGRVVQLSTRLAQGIFEVEQIPDSRILVGAVAGGGLGTVVTELGDIDGDGAPEVGLGAPFAANGSLPEAGVTYVLLGRPIADATLGVVDLAQGVPGIQLVGDQANGRAGSAVASAGDSDGDGLPDFTIGAPDRGSVDPDDDDGQIYIVLLSDFAGLSKNGTGDTDGDAVADCRDNCVITLNPTQADRDNDGVGDACDTNPVVSVPNDFLTLADAMALIDEGGTRIEVSAAADGGCYDGVRIDAARPVSIVGVGDDPSEWPCIDGGSRAAITLTEAAGVRDYTIRNVVLQGQSGIVAAAPTRVEGVRFREIAGTAIELDAAEHFIRDVEMDASVMRGIRVGECAAMELRDATLAGVAVTGIEVAGDADVINTLVVDTAAGSRVRRGGLTGNAIAVSGVGVLDLRHSTLANAAGLAVDNLGSGVVTIEHSILTPNGLGDVAGVDCSAVQWSLVCADANCAGCGGNNLAAEPLFVSPPADYHLAADSPGLDFGPDATAAFGPAQDPCADREGRPRILDYEGDGIARVDAGALESLNGRRTPGPVSGLVWLDAQTFGWSPARGANEYDVYRATLGAVDELLCVGPEVVQVDAASRQATETNVPLPGTGWSYVVTGGTTSGAEGSQGLASCVERSNVNSCRNPAPVQSAGSQPFQ